MNAKLTAAQKRWQEQVRELGSILTGGPAEIHHPIGAKGKHNKLLIGPWWIVPLTTEEHKALHANDEAILTDPIGVKMTRKEFEKWAFGRVLSKIDAQDWPALEYIEAIEGYHR